MGRLSRQEQSDPEPEEPDPGRAGARFLAWLIKIGQRSKLAIAKKEWSKIKERDPGISDMELEDFISMVGKERLYVARLRGVKVLVLTKDGIEWARSWTIHYKVHRGHHSQFMKMRIE